MRARAFAPLHMSASAEEEEELESQGIDMDVFSSVQSHDQVPVEAEETEATIVKTE
jgi:hypothetical protein